MKRLLVLVAALNSLPALAECDPVDISHDSANLHLRISTGCDSSETISFTKKVKYAKTLDGKKYIDNSNWPHYPIEKECTWKKRRDDLPKPGWEILSCHPGGRTPLAGATYELKRTGTRYQKYDTCYAAEPVKLEKPIKVDVWHYVCISGCAKEGVPQKLSVPPESGYCS
jgi:hypothetical protein